MLNPFISLIKGIKLDRVVMWMVYIFLTVIDFVYSFVQFVDLSWSTMSIIGASLCILFSAVTLTMSVAIENHRKTCLLLFVISIVSLSMLHRIN